MISLEQVKLLETKIARAIEYVEQVAGENAKLIQKEAVLVQNEAVLIQKEAALLQNEAELRAKLESYQKRIDELEVLVMRFKEDQTRIEDGILSALDRLSQFEDAVAKSLGGEKPDAPAAEPEKPPADPAAEAVKTAEAAKPAVPEKPKTKTPPAAPGPGEIFFEITEHETDDDIEDQLGEGGDQDENGELDIF
jgi:hypothetical protein